MNALIRNIYCIYGKTRTIPKLPKAGRNDIKNTMALLHLELMTQHRSFQSEEILDFIERFLKK